MQKEEIYVRDARREDAGEIARFFLMAWPVESFLEDNPGMTEEEFAGHVADFVRMEDTIYSYMNTIVAAYRDENGNEVLCGAMNGYDGASYEALKAPIIKALEDIRPSLSGDFAKVQETRAGEFYFDSVGVCPTMRSKGIGSLLFKGMEQRAVNLGHETAGLIVDISKPKAEALYNRIGFHFVGYVDFLGNRMKHLQKTLV